MENREKFASWKNKLEGIDIHKPLDCLRAVEINLSNVCNRACRFCPHSKGWTTDKPDYMSIDTAKEIARQLKEFNFTGYVCVAGWGEPSLNSLFKDILKCFEGLHVEIATNGMLLTHDDWQEIADVCEVNVSVHDWNQLKYYKNKFKDTKAALKNHDEINPEMNLYNRAGYMYKPKETTNNQCNLIYYQITIDTDGTYTMCAADWARKSQTEMNIFNTPIKEYFINKMYEKKKLMLEGRQSIDMCRYCDINGLMIGDKFKEYFKNQTS